MAGDWFPLQYWRSRCPEIVRISSATGRTRHEVLGWVCDFWSWVSTESADGKVPGVYVRDLPEIVGADAELWAAVQAVGWVGEDGGGIVVPGWDAWLCESAKKRAKDAQRKRGERVREASAKRPRSVRLGADKRPPTGQDRTGHKEDPPNPPQAGGGGGPAVAIPAALDTPEFRAAWDRWKAERRAKRHRPYTAAGEEQQLKKLAAYGPAVALAAIRESIAQGWQGLFPKAPTGRAPPRSGGETAIDLIQDAIAGDD